MEDYQVRDAYILLAVSVLDRACMAFGLHGSFGSTAEALYKLEEEHHELAVEVLESDYGRIYEEAIDVAVVALRTAHLAKEKLKNVSNPD